MADEKSAAKSVRALIDENLFESSRIEEKSDGAVVHIEGVEDEHRQIDTILQHIQRLSVLEIYPLWDDNRAEIKVEDRRQNED